MATFGGNLAKARLRGEEQDEGVLEFVIRLSHHTSWMQGCCKPLRLPRPADAIPSFARASVAITYQEVRQLERREYSSRRFSSPNGGRTQGCPGRMSFLQPGKQS
jgi:hypothetical protein